MNNPLKNDQGVALVVTLAIVAILLATAIQLAKFTGDAVEYSIMDDDQFQAYEMAISGINLAVLILVEDAKKNTIDSVQEAWSDPDKLMAAVESLGFERGKLKLKIFDELSKIQVNALIWEFPGNRLHSNQVQIWENFLRLKFSGSREMDGRDPAEIVNSVKDWLDSGDDDAITGMSGAESDYYLDLDPAYLCANGPFNHIDELFSVKGISKELLMADGEQKSPDRDQDEAKNPLELEDVFTVYGLDKNKSPKGGYRYPGRININTANVDVLAALLPEGMEALARELADFRDQKSQEGTIFINPLDKGWYKKVINLSEKESDRLDHSIRYESDIFKVDCSAQKNDAAVILVAIVKREKLKESGKWICRIIQMERE